MVEYEESFFQKKQWILRIGTHFGLIIRVKQTNGEGFRIINLLIFLRVILSFKSLNIILNALLFFFLNLCQSLLLDNLKTLNIWIINGLSIIFLLLIVNDFHFLALRNGQSCCCFSFFYSLNSLVSCYEALSWGKIIHIIHILNAW
jgi:hypothetical protein